MAGLQKQVLNYPKCRDRRPRRSVVAVSAGGTRGTDSSPSTTLRVRMTRKNGFFAMLRMTEEEFRSLCHSEELATKNPFSFAGGERWERRRGRPRCSALPVADKAEHKCVPGSIADAVDLSTRKISGTPNGQSDLSEWQRSAIEEGVSRRREGRAPQQEDCRPYDGCGNGRTKFAPTRGTGCV